MNDPSPSDRARYRIGTVAKLTGISTHQLRIWERRYATVTPTRSEGGDRLYSDEDVERLKLLKQLTDLGHSIGNVARLPRQELERMLSTLHKPAAAPSQVDVAAHVSGSFLDAIERMDTATAERALSRGSVALEPRQFTSDVLIPILHEVGRRWQEGKFNAAHEHAASGMLRTQLGSLMRLYASEPTAPVAVCSTPSGELHEFGALAAALFAASRGWRVVYLGPNLPAADIVSAAALAKARLVLLSVVMSPAEATRAEIEHIATLLPSSMQIVIGGHGVRNLDNPPARLRLVSKLEDFGTWL